MPCRPVNNLHNLAGGFPPFGFALPSSW